MNHVFVAPFALVLVAVMVIVVVVVVVVVVVLVRVLVGVLVGSTNNTLFEKSIRPSASKVFCGSLVSLLLHRFSIVLIQNWCLIVVLNGFDRF